MSSFEGLYGALRVEVEGLAKSEVRLLAIGYALRANPGEFAQSANISTTTRLRSRGLKRSPLRRSHCATRKNNVNFKIFEQIILLLCRVVSVSERQHTSRDCGSDEECASVEDVALK